MKKIKNLIFVKEIHLCPTKKHIYFSHNKRYGTTFPIYSCDCLFLPNSKYRLWRCLPSKYEMNKHTPLYGEIYDIFYISKCDSVIYNSSNFQRTIFKNEILNMSQFDEAIFIIQQSQKFANLDMIHDNNKLFTTITTTNASSPSAVFDNDRNFYNLLLMAKNFMAALQSCEGSVIIYESLI